MDALFTIAPIAVFIIGVMMVAKNYKKGWAQTDTLSGIAFILISLPSVLSMIGI
jgi:Na+/melibiose symporter-like transporter